MQGTRYHNDDNKCHSHVKIKIVLISFILVLFYLVDLWMLSLPNKNLKLV